MLTLETSAWKEREILGRASTAPEDWDRNLNNWQISSSWKIYKIYFLLLGINKVFCKSLSQLL